MSGAVGAEPLWRLDGEERGAAELRAKTTAACVRLAAALGVPDARVSLRAPSGAATPAWQPARAGWVASLQGSGGYYREGTGATALDAELALARALVLDAARRAAELEVAARLGERELARLEDAAAAVASS